VTMSEEKPATIEARVRRAVRGSVISARMDKSITVLVVRQFKHPLYKRSTSAVLRDCMLMMRAMIVKKEIPF